jgi:hypothetical protein
LAPLAIDSLQSAALEAIVIPLCMSRIFNLMTRCVDLARRNFMQQGLPEVSRIPVDEYYIGAAFSAHAIAEPCGKLESGRAPANDDDAMRRFDGLPIAMVGHASSP